MSPQDVSCVESIEPREVSIIPTPEISFQSGGLSNYDGLAFQNSIPLESESLSFPSASLPNQDFLWTSKHALATESDPVLPLANQAQNSVVYGGELLGFEDNLYRKATPSIPQNPYFPPPMSQSWPVEVQPLALYPPAYLRNRSMLMHRLREELLADQAILDEYQNRMIQRSSGLPLYYSNPYLDDPSQYVYPSIENNGL